MFVDEEEFVDDEVEEFDFDFLEPLFCSEDVVLLDGVVVVVEVEFVFKKFCNSCGESERVT